VSVEEVRFDLDLNITKITSNIQKIEGILIRTITLLRKLGLPEEFDAAIIKIQRLITTVRLLHAALIAMSASNPYTAVFGLLGLISGAASLGDMMAGY